MDEDNDVVIDMSRPSAPMAMIALLQSCADKEKTFWASKYQDDLAFRTKIDNFVTFQALAIKLKDEGKVPPAELDQAFCNLGSMLADAFGMVDPLTGKWSKPTQEACARAGAEYSRASVWAFAYAQAPGMARSMLNLLGQAAVGLGAPPLVATVVQHLTGFTASIAQLPVSMLATQWNADQQSDCVQQMKGKNPEFVPNVISTKIVKPDGTSVELRPLSHVQEDLNDLDWVSKLLDSGTEADLTSASLLYSGKIDEADARLLKQLSKATAKLGTLQQQGRALNAIEIELKNPKRDQRERAELLSKVSRGPTALPGPLKLETKRCLEQINHWELLVKDLDAARDALKAQRLAKLESAKKDLVDDGNGFAGDIESSMSDYSDSNETTPVATNAAPDPRPVLKSDALRKVHSDRAFEQIQILQYRAMNVLTNQSYSRWVRSWLFVTGASGQLILQLAQHIAGKDLGPASDVWQLATSLAQTIIYAWQQPKMSGEDYLNKLATQWNIVAMTGTGSFVDKAGKVVPSKLDAAVTGPLLTRLTTFASILIFDRSVYTQSILGWVVDPHTLDDEAAIAAVLELPTKDKNGKAVKDEDGNLVLVPRLVPCTYLSLAAEFHSLPDRSYRKRFVIELIEKLEIGEEIGSSMLRNLECYEDNEANIASAKSGDLNSLLSKLISSSEAGLLPETIELFGCFVLSQSPPDAIEHDEQIMRQRTLPSELSSLAAKFQNLSHREEREDFVIDLANEHPHLDENAKAAIKQYLATYEKKREAPSADVAGMLSDSLLAALGDKTKEHEDRKLFKLMAAVEQRSEAGTLQAAQKFGQQFAWIGAGTGSVLVARSLFTFAAQAIIAREDIREYRYGRDEDALAALAGRLLATKVTGNLMAIVSSLISLGLGYAYHEYILCKNVQRGASGSNLSVVNTPAPSLFKALPQEFLAFLRYPDARVEEVTDYSTLAGRQVPEADRPPKMKFTRQIKLTEATWEQMFSADLAPPADLGPWGKLKDVWETWSGYFTEEHGSLAEMTESQLAVAIKKDLDKVMHYLKQEQEEEEEEEDQSVSPTQEARINTSKKEHLDGAAPTRIDDDEHPLIPLHIPLISMPRFEPVNTPRTPRTGMPSLPTTPRTQASQPPKSPPTTPRNQASSTQKTGTIRPLEYRSQGRQNELTRRIARGKAISVTKVPGGGESVIERVQLDADPSDILRFDTHNDLPPSADNAPPVENYFVTQPQLGNPSPAMQKLHWKPLERSQALEQGDGPKAIFTRMATQNPPPVATSNSST
ncbi:hypothetical protein H4CHR_01919 [Variovorax sp. PBS-H4]|uniref:hypothetical protein n=1 Tax=Variovorax sp. PBS-H4 TaxID=434008 RepID=UPI001316010B|nr:hypothetical protein [Variovorax sp. PBS-H4]VTU27064.1 hypothetical protein H4CHR_01919 [Variovorax sp. PBS-H4]